MRRDLGRLAAGEHDLLVVGGGICGAAAAWDAAQRGLAVALVEAEDFGSGVSWNSLKTIHGGLRHLQRLDLAGLRESVRERRALLRIAPELVRPLPFLVPTYGHGLRGREALAVGLRLNDVLSLDRNAGLPPAARIPAGRCLGPREVLERVPGLPRQGLTGGIVWTDAQAASSERLLIGFLHAASGAGAVLANRVEVSGLRRAGSRVVGACARDGRSGATLEIRARVVLNAAGPGFDRLLQLAGLAPRRVPLLRARNLVLRRPLVAEQAVGAAQGGRFLFLVPWNGTTMVGTAYDPASLAEAEAVARFLDDARRAFPWAALDGADVALVHRGLVPGVSARGLWTRPLLVDHEAEDGVAGLISALGVKYTTARGLAQRAVDRACRSLGRRAPPCRTHVTPLPLARPLAGSLEEQARRAAREEMALTLADAVLRRMDLGTAGPPSPADVDAVLEAMGAELGWDGARRQAERRALEAFYLGYD